MDTSGSMFQLTAGLPKNGCVWVRTPSFAHSDRLVVGELRLLQVPQPDIRGLLGVDPVLGLEIGPADVAHGFQLPGKAALATWLAVQKDVPNMVPRRKQRPNPA